MPILDLAVRFQDTYRVRLGDQEGKRPRALTDCIRITAAGPEAPQAFCDVYGSVGDRGVTEWEDDKSPDCWEVYLPVNALPIWILPGQVLTQWWELYRGKVCERRCEGTGGQETLSGKPCMCVADIDARIKDPKQCNIMTRLSIMCPDVPQILGSGSLVTHSRIAAETFQGAMYQAGPWLSKNVPVAAVLRTHTHKGRTTFTFPNIEVGGPVDRTPELDAAPQRLQIEAGPSAAAPALERGSERGEADRAATPAPPQHEPFNEADEQIIDAVTARALKATATEAGLTTRDLFDIVADITGTGGVLNKVLRADWPEVETAVYEAISVRRSEAS